MCRSGPRKLNSDFLNFLLKEELKVCLIHLAKGWLQEDIAWDTWSRAEEPFNPKGSVVMRINWNKLAMNKFPINIKQISSKSQSSGVTKL